MTVLEIYDKHNREIPREQWNEYGIIDNKQELEKQFDLEFKQRHRAKLKQQQRMIQVKQSQFMQMAPSSSSSNLVKRTMVSKCNRSRSDLKNVRMIECDKGNRPQSEQQLNSTELLVELLLAASHGLCIPN
mmetsp:Transcript_48760/g.77945  ORF Transcript_48760/g.77945 Transcript_48760/m.77945 type:complete len:131 (+) Transcript_48760:1-393(+)